MSVISVSVVTINASDGCTEEVGEEERGRIEMIGDFTINKDTPVIIH